MSDPMWSCDPTVTLYATALKETDAALLCGIDGESVWIPKSQIRDGSEVHEEGEEGDLVITEWIAKKKGLVP
jgi:hypothetical protein